MAIDPVTGITIGAIQTAANIQTDIKVQQKLKQSTDRRSETIRIANENMYNQAVQRTNDEPLGWMWSAGIGSFERYYTKSEYLEQIVGRTYMLDINLRGWNPAWGDMETEIAIARREYRASLKPANAESILAEPLENFHLEIRHFEMPWEKEERLKREAQKHNREFMIKYGIWIILFDLWVIILIILSN